jgi:hypothetical protein
VRVAASLTDSVVAVGLNAVMMARPRARASTKSELDSRAMRRILARPQQPTKDPRAPIDP